MQTVVVLEDEIAVRQWLCDLVRRSASLKLVGDAGSVREGIELLQAEPDILLLDLMLEDGPAFELIGQAKLRRAKVLIVSVLGDEDSVVRSVMAGADGYLTKEASRSDLLEAIEAVDRGDAPMSPAIARHLLKLVKAPRPEDAAGEEKSVLTRRERQVLEALAMGLTYKEVARKYELSPLTVAKYIKTIYSKLSVHNRAEAVMAGVRQGIIQV